jgi:hypothetical protein
MIGVDDVHIGLLQNGTADTAAVTYANGTVKREHLKGSAPDAGFPVLDATYYPNPAEPFAIFIINTGATPGPGKYGPGTRRDPVSGDDPNGGQDRTLDTVDSPTIGFDTTDAGSQAVSTTGANEFSDYIAAYSDDYDKMYVGYINTYWIAQFQYTRSPAGVWQNSGSSITAVAANGSTPAVPVKLAAPVVQTKGTPFPYAATFG